VVEFGFSTVGTAASVGIVVADDNASGGVGVGDVAAWAEIAEAEVVALSCFFGEPEPSGQGILGILCNEGQEVSAHSSKIAKSQPVLRYEEVRTRWWCSKDSN
jgi:hypothetical protein